MRPDKIDISPELREKAEACKTPDELLELDRQEGYELSDEELQSVAAAAKPGIRHRCPRHFAR